ncbi:MAG: type II toxin-antitoxin system Phd/YefM family antitoxin [Kiritimatiellae bacterium]|nr:type II toxin-antitoxin system Phd/YefM family antitoxin [Kiritimatiellia bacterium]
MGISVSSFRSNIYKILDEVVKTGKPLELNRKGSSLAVISLDKKKKLDNLVKHSVMEGDPQELVELDCTEGWSSDLS